VREALRSVALGPIRSHLKACATAAIKAGEESADAMYDELVELMHKHMR
jgi:DNA-binding FrmR family transcriptional regulator